MNTVNARSFHVDCRVIEGQTGGWTYEGSAVVVEIAIHTGNKSPQVVDAVDVVVGGLKKDRQDGALVARPGTAVCTDGWAGGT